MKKSRKILSPTETIALYDLFNTVLYILGLKNIVTKQLLLPKTFIKVYDKILSCSYILLFIFMVSNLASFYTQKNLPLFLDSMRNGLTLCSSFIFVYNALFYYNKPNVINIIFDLIVTLKQEYNNKEIEKLMIRRIKKFFFAYLIMHTINISSLTVMTIFRVIIYDEPYVVFIAAWPDVQDRSKAGQFVRLLYDLSVWFFIMRVVVAMSVMMILLLSLTHQYMNLQQYFYNIKEIFNEDLSTIDKENKYEEAYKKGIRQHIITLECVNKCQDICHPIFCGELALNFIYTMILLPSIIKEQSSLEEKAQLGVIYVVCLVQLGVSMWNAGDITHEASKLPTAMYTSGWQNCRNNAKRIRSLLVISMLRAQQPVVMKAFIIVELSYDTYVKIIKTSYSIFSVFYSI